MACTNVMHNDLTCAQAKLSFEEWCQPCRMGAVSAPVTLVVDTDEAAFVILTSTLSIPGSPMRVVCVRTQDGWLALHGMKGEQMVSLPSCFELSAEACDALEARLQAFLMEDE